MTLLENAKLVLACEAGEKKEKWSGFCLRGRYWQFRHFHACCPNMLYEYVRTSIRHEDQTPYEYLCTRSRVSWQSFKCRYSHEQILEKVEQDHLILTKTTGVTMAKKIFSLI